MPADWSEFYNRRVGVMMWPAEEAVRCINRYKGLLKKRDLGLADVKAIDIGCGNGRHLWALSREGFTNLYATDRTQTIDTAPFGLTDGKDYRFFTRDITAGPLPETYDFIICHGVIDHFDSPEAVRGAFGNVLQALNPGGWIYLSLCSDIPAGTCEVVSEEPGLRIVKYTSGVEKGFCQGLFKLGFVEKELVRIGKDGEFSIVYTEDRCRTVTGPDGCDRWGRLFVVIERALTE